MLHASHRSGRPPGSSAASQYLDIICFCFFACLRFSLHIDFSDSCICCWHLHCASPKAGLEPGVCALVMFLCAIIQLPVHDTCIQQLSDSVFVSV